MSHERALEVLKDYLDLVRNFAFSASLIVVSGVVFYDPAPLVGKVPVNWIVDALAVLSFIYVLAAIIYVIVKHWPKKKRYMVIMYFVFFVLTFSMESMLLMVTRHVELTHSVQRKQVSSQPHVAGGKGP